MDIVADTLATEIFEKPGAERYSIPPERRLLIGICGIPASGKTTLSLNIVKRLNMLQDGIAVCVGLDGWHLSRAKLDMFENVKEAYDRRGAEFTFDAASYVKFITTLRQSPCSITPPPVQNHLLYAPTFDHSLKDPSPNALLISPSHRIVIIEGLYTFIDTPAWRIAAEALDERWLVEVDTTEATKRLMHRHVATGITKDLDEGRWRAENNDMPNGLWVLEHMMEPTRRIKSITEHVP